MLRLAVPAFLAPVAEPRSSSRRRDRRPAGCPRARRSRRGERGAADLGQHLRVPRLRHDHRGRSPARGGLARVLPSPPGSTARGSRSASARSPAPSSHSPPSRCAVSSAPPRPRSTRPSPTWRISAIGILVRCSSSSRRPASCAAAGHPHPAGGRGRRLRPQHRPQRVVRPRPRLGHRRVGTVIAQTGMAAGPSSSSWAVCRGGRCRPGLRAHPGRGARGRPGRRPPARPHPGPARGAPRDDVGRGRPGRRPARGLPGDRDDLDLPRLRPRRPRHRGAGHHRPGPRRRRRRGDPRRDVAHAPLGRRGRGRAASSCCSCARSSDRSSRPTSRPGGHRGRARRRRPRAAAVRLRRRRRAHRRRRGGGWPAP